MAGNPILACGLFPPSPMRISAAIPPSGRWGGGGEYHGGGSRAVYRPDFQSVLHVVHQRIDGGIFNRQVEQRAGSRFVLNILKRCTTCSAIFRLCGNPRRSLGPDGGYAADDQVRRRGIIPLTRWTACAAPAPAALAANGVSLESLAQYKTDRAALKRHLESLYNYYVAVRDTTPRCGGPTFKASSILWWILTAAP